MGQALGTHGGSVHILNLDGTVVKSFDKQFKPHAAVVYDLSIDLTSEFVASASMDGEYSLDICIEERCQNFCSIDTGKVVVQSLVHLIEPPTVFDLHRPMRCVALEPNYGKRSTRQLVSGGMAGSLVLHEKGWLGYKEVVLHSGEGPIWAVVWSGTFIAWANDAVS